MDTENHSKMILETLKDWSDKDKEIITEGMELLSLHREIEMFKEIQGSRYNLSIRQIEILERLFFHPEKQLTPAELADEVYLTRSTMTGNLDSLQQKGYVSRESHPRDRRMTLVKITDEGIEFCRKIMPEKYSEILKVMKSLTTEERNIMKTIYSKLLVLIKETALEVVN